MLRKNFIKLATVASILLTTTCFSADRNEVGFKGNAGFNLGTDGVGLSAFAGAEYGDFTFGAELELGYGFRDAKSYLNKNRFDDLTEENIKKSLTEDEKKKYTESESFIKEIQDGTDKKKQKTYEYLKSVSLYTGVKNGKTEAGQELVIDTFTKNAFKFKLTEKFFADKNKNFNAALTDAKYDAKTLNDYKDKAVVVQFKDFVFDNLINKNYINYLGSQDYFKNTNSFSLNTPQDEQNRKLTDVENTLEFAKLYNAEVSNISEDLNSYIKSLDKKSFAKNFEIIGGEIKHLDGEKIDLSVMDIALNQIYFDSDEPKSSKMKKSLSNYYKSNKVSGSHAQEYFKSVEGISVVDNAADVKTYFENEEKKYNESLELAKKQVAKSTESYLKQNKSFMNDVYYKVNLIGSYKLYNDGESELLLGLKSDLISMFKLFGNNKERLLGNGQVKFLEAKNTLELFAKFSFSLVEISDNLAVKAFAQVGLTPVGFGVFSGGDSENKKDSDTVAKTTISAVKTKNPAATTAENSSKFNIFQKTLLDNKEMHKVTTMQKVFSIINIKIGVQGDFTA